MCALQLISNFYRAGDIVSTGPINERRDRERRWVAKDSAVIHRQCKQFRGGEPETEANTSQLGAIPRRRSWLLHGHASSCPLPLAPTPHIAAGLRRRVAVCVLAQAELRICDEEANNLKRCRHECSHSLSSRPRSRGDLLTGRSFELMLEFFRLLAQEVGEQRAHTRDHRELVEGRERVHACQRTCPQCMDVPP
jgi:hypothetical protein